MEISMENGQGGAQVVKAYGIYNGLSCENQGDIFISGTSSEIKVKSLACTMKIKTFTLPRMDL